MVVAIGTRKLYLGLVTNIVQLNQMTKVAGTLGW